MYAVKGPDDHLLDGMFVALGFLFHPGLLFFFNFYKIVGSLY
jgi:hypothetical protein